MPAKRSLGVVSRRRWDSNPRYRCRYTTFPGWPLQPLEHLSEIYYFQKEICRYKENNSNQLTGAFTQPGVPFILSHSFCNIPSFWGTLIHMNGTSRPISSDRHAFAFCNLHYLLFRSVSQQGSLHLQL
jgi:hypothetical protein